MNKVYVVRNNNKYMGKCDVNINNFKQMLISSKEYSKVDNVYYEVKNDDTLFGIVSSYLSDPDRIEEVVERIKRENGIDEVKSGDLIILHDVPRKFQNDFYIKEIISEIEDRFSFIKDYMSSVDEDDHFKIKFVIDFMSSYINTGVYRNMDNLFKCLEKCRELSDMIVLSTKENLVTK